MRGLQAAGGTAIVQSRPSRILSPGRARALSLVIGVLGFLADLATKTWALTSLSTPIQLIPGVLYLRLIRNPGAAFSMGESFTVALTCLAIAATVFLLAWVLPRVRHLGWTIVAGLLLAGVTGNLWDRLTREPGPFHGHVIDMIQVPFFAVFNVADIWISCAAVLVVWLSMVTKVGLDGQPATDKPPADAPR